MNRKLAMVAWVAGGCCGGPQQAPENVQITGASTTTTYSTSTSTSTSASTTGDTAAPVGFECVESDPSLALTKSGEPLPEEITFAYYASCGGGPAVELEVVPAGLVPGEMAVSWKLSVDGFDPVESSATWTLDCQEDGTIQPGSLGLDLPKKADQSAATLTVQVTDSAGTRVETSHTFLAEVEGG